MMSDFQIISDHRPQGDQPEAIAQLVQGLNDGHKHQTLLGVTGSGKTFTMANVIEQVQRPTIILSHNKTLAAQLFGEFKSLFPHNAVEYFISYYDYYQPEAYLPVTDLYIEKDSSVNEDIDRLRLKATSALLERRDVIVVASVSCIFGIGSPRQYEESVVRINRGDEVDRRELIHRLIDIHYVRNDVVLERGNFRVRGDLMEIYPAYLSHCVRVEFFGDRVDRILTFDPLTGEIDSDKEGLERTFIYPAKHFVTTQETVLKAVDEIRTELIDRLEWYRDEGMLLEAQRLEQRTNYDIEMLLEVGYCNGIENYSRILDGRRPGERPHTLLDFFPDDFLMFIDESHATLPQVRAMYNGDRSRKEVLVEHGFRLPSAMDNRPMTFAEFETKLGQVIFVSATPAEYELDKSHGVVVEQIIRPTGLLDPPIDVRPSKGQIDDLLAEIKRRTAKRERVLVTTLTKRMSEDLTDYLKGMDLLVNYLHSEIDTLERVVILRNLRLGKFDVLVGINLLREGLDLPEVSLVVVLDADKEGFLRSATSLMQVAGRAARHINGKVIFYCERITHSMQEVIDESTRRRVVQEAYNQAHGITPTTIYKSVEDIMLSTSVADARTQPLVVAEAAPAFNLSNLDEQETIITLDLLRREMKRAAEALRFEEAARLRDEIVRIEQGQSTERAPS
ncbi:MAG: excinuclease ABC subunit UvrB [Candidatus Marinimicrobia bacterium]|nr:excinuclease ABC subunit UvrB [Candidatus Neomarinimicrobiota bacterium]